MISKIAGWRRFEILAFIVPLICFVSSEIAAQDRVVITQDVANPESIISLIPVAEIGGSKEGPYVGMNTYVRQNSKGEFYAVMTADEWQLAECNVEGEFIGNLGRQGSGPGEYISIDNLVIDPNDQLYIFDSGNARGTVLDSNGEYIRNFPIIWQTTQACFTESGQLVVQALISTPDRVGLPFHLINVDGSIERSFGDLDPNYDGRTASWLNTKILAPSIANTIWSGKVNEYTIELWNTSGNRLKIIENQRDWFKGWYTVERGQEVTRPKPTLLAMQEDGQGLLWVIINIANANWSTDIDTGDALFPGIHQMHYDSMVEVLDTKTGKLLGFGRFDIPIRYFVGNGLVAQFKEKQNNEITISISEVKLINP